jgi:hypothetical protein
MCTVFLCMTKRTETVFVERYDTDWKYFRTLGLYGARIMGSGGSARIATASMPWIIGGGYPVATTTIGFLLWIASGKRRKSIGHTGDLDVYGSWRNVLVL